MALTEKIIGVESGGRRYAKNPRSSAYGPGQFISSTWLSMIDKYRPDLAEGRSKAEILELRSDPAISREMTSAYASENAEYLKSRGFEPTESTTYLAHFAGPDGAADLLENPQAPARSVLSPAAITANPFLKDWTAQQVIDWASGKMGGDAPKPKLTASSAGSTGGMLDEALAATQSATDAKGAKMDPLTVLMSIMGGGGPETLASLGGDAMASSIGVGTAGSPTAANMATTAAPQSTFAGDLARSGGYGETGGMLDSLFGGEGSSGAATANKINSGEQDAGQNLVQHTEAINKQMLASMMQPQTQGMDFKQLAQILQRRSTLGL